MLVVNNISIQFGGRYLFDNVSFAVDKGQRIGLIGRNGAGKTTLLKIIADEYAPDEGNVSKPKYYTIGYLPQEINIISTKPLFDEVKSALIEINQLSQSLDDLTNEISNRTDYESNEYQKVTENLAQDTERFSILGGHSIDAIIERTLLGLGFLREDFSKPLDTFSGGWQMRMELSKILLCRPDIILLDEPTNHLDIESIFWVETFLKNYEGAVIVVSHDKKFLDTVTNRTIEIINGKTYDMGLAFSEFLKVRAEQKVQQLNAYKNQQRHIAQQERFIERFRSKSTLATRVQSKVKQLDKLERIELDEEQIKAMNLRFPEGNRAGRTIIDINLLSKRFDDNLVLDKIDFAIERGERIAFVGKNGEGKSTLSRIIAGIEEYEGKLEVGYNMQISYFAQQQANQLMGDKTVFQTIDDAAVGNLRTNVRNILGAFLFSGDAQDKKVKVLSGGEKARLALAKLILEPSNLLVLDEPTNHLDMLSKDVLKKALLNYSGALIVVSHDRDFLEGLTTKTVEFKNKGIQSYQGGINDYLYKLKLDGFDELERNKKINSAKSDLPQSQNQLDRQKRKDANKERNRLQKNVLECEKKIEKYETRKAEIEALFANTEFFQEANVSKIEAEYEELKTSLDEVMENWTMAEEELEALLK
ncbi:MAG: glycosyl transferase family 2 [Bacteroidetes bacterium 4572_77]|nr:MAG: glycosyl transferase family 2 [Bacteroidetes bacterium 4572_77]